MTPRASSDGRGRQSRDSIARFGLRAPREYGGDDVRVAGQTGNGNEHIPGREADSRTHFRLLNHPIIWGERKTKTRGPGVRRRIPFGSIAGEKPAPFAL